MQFTKLATTCLKLRDISLNYFWRSAVASLHCECFHLKRLVKMSVSRVDVPCHSPFPDIGGKWDDAISTARSRQVEKFLHWCSSPKNVPRPFFCYVLDVSKTKSRVKKRHSVNIWTALEGAAEQLNANAKMETRLSCRYQNKLWCQFFHFWASVSTGHPARIFSSVRRH